VLEVVIKFHKENLPICDKDDKRRDSITLLEGNHFLITYGGLILVPTQNEISDKTILREEKINNLKKNVMIREYLIG
jgi:hypothetical protein